VTIRVVLRELLDGDADGPIGEVLVLALSEDHLPEYGIVEVEEVTDDAPEHWAWTFNTRTYTIRDIKRLIVEDQLRRRRA
jgi:hypothetical protein